MSPTSRLFCGDLPTIPIPPWSYAHLTLHRQYGDLQSHGLTHLLYCEMFNDNMYSQTRSRFRPPMCHLTTEFNQPDFNTRASLSAILGVIRAFNLITWPDLPWREEGICDSFSVEFTAPVAQLVLV